MFTAEEPIIARKKKKTPGFQSKALKQMGI